MSYYDVMSKYKEMSSTSIFKVSTADAAKAISLSDINERQFAALLSEEAEPYLEKMAAKSRDITLRYFGKVIQLYTPLYLSNYCDNECLYCGFNASNSIERKALTVDEVKAEAEAISRTGLKHILVLTGESRVKSPLGYIKECVSVLKERFSSVSVEIYPLSEAEYRELAEEGVDGLTVYQEVYDEEIYRKMHPKGPKSDYRFRLDAPERGAKSGIRAINIGALLGLAEWRKEIFLAGLHAKYILEKFPDVEVALSLPRIRPQVASFRSAVTVSDKNIVQAILALRLFLPRAGITISTREEGRFRENLIGLGVTKMSAGSVTCVGGHAGLTDEKKGIPQFEISDPRGVDEIDRMLEAKGYQAVFKDWMNI